MFDHNPQSMRVPDFSSREEEAEWWDTHSIVDYLDELEPIQIRYAQPEKSRGMRPRAKHGGTLPGFVSQSVWHQPRFWGSDRRRLRSPITR